MALTSLLDMIPFEVSGMPRHISICLLDCNFGVSIGVIVGKKDDAPYYIAYREECDQQNPDMLEGDDVDEIKQFINELPYWTIDENKTGEQAGEIQDFLDEVNALKNKF